jgi:hypothetical protein
MRVTQRRPFLAAVTCLALAVPLTATMTPAIAQVAPPVAVPISADATASDATTTLTAAAVSSDATILSAVRINEVDSNGAVPVDWIELTNISAETVDVSGLILHDNKLDKPVVIPAGSTIAAGAFFAVDVDTTTGFGLGGGDSARLFLGDGTTLVDSYTWTEHAGTTYGRYPDGTGAFVLTGAATKAAPNVTAAPTEPTDPTQPTDPTVPALSDVRVNEVESNDGTPGDWIELVNAGTAAVDISGWIVIDNNDEDPTHRYRIPAGTTIAAGGFYLVEEAATGYGLGGADSARLYAADGVTLVDSRSWTSHATTTYGLCGTAFVTTTSSTKGAANDCSSPVRINEIESNDGTPGDWVELRNNGGASVDISGYVIKDNADDHAFVVPTATTLAAGAYYVADVDADEATGFGLGGNDSVRLFAATGTQIDSYSWTSHATSTFARCADGTGEFATSASSTKGAVNDCVGDLVTAPWPGSADVATVDVQNELGGNMSGLAFEATANGDVLWAVKNGVGGLFKLVNDGTNWVSDSADGWENGKVLHYADGTGDVDAEGVALTDAGAAGGIFVASERNNDGGGSRLSVLRYDASRAGTHLSASVEWNLTADLPTVGANEGLEAIAWVPDEVLVADGLLDESTNAAYNPANYDNHAGGLFFVGVEKGGAIYAYALNQANGDYHRVATIASGFPGVMELEFEAESGSLWAICDDGCDGRSAVLDIAQQGASDGRFVVSTVFERPASMPNLNNEGFAIAPQSECVAGAKAVFWADDANTDGFAIRAGSLDCTESTDPTEPTDPTIPVEPTDPTTPVDPATPVAGNPGATTPASDAALTSDARGTVDAPSSARAGSTISVTIGSALAGDTVNVWLHSEPVLIGTRVVAGNGTVSVTIPANTPFGAHRVVVLAEDGTLIGWDSITVTAAAGQTLASTGADTELPLRAALLLLIAGAGLMVLRRTRARV